MIQLRGIMVPGFAVETSNRNFSTIDSVQRGLVGPSILWYEVVMGEAGACTLLASSSRIASL